MADSGNREEENVTRRDKKEGQITGGKAETRVEAQTMVAPEGSRPVQDRAARTAATKKKAVAKKKTVAKKKAVPKKKVSAKKKTVRKTTSATKKARNQRDTSRGVVPASGAAEPTVPMQGAEPPVEDSHATDEPQAVTLISGADSSTETDTSRARGAKTAEPVSEAQAAPVSSNTTEQKPTDQRPQRQAGTKTTRRAAGPGSEPQPRRDAEAETTDDVSSAWGKQEPAATATAPPPPKLTKRTNYWPWAAFLVFVVISVFVLNGRSSDTGPDSQSRTVALGTSTDEALVQGVEAQSRAASTAQVAAQKVPGDDPLQPAADVPLSRADALQVLQSAQKASPLVLDDAVEMPGTDVAVESERPATAAAKSAAEAGSRGDAPDEIVMAAGVTEDVATEVTETGAERSQSDGSAVTSTPGGLDDESFAGTTADPASAQLAVTEDAESLGDESLGAGSPQDLGSDATEAPADVAAVETPAEAGVELSSFADTPAPQSSPAAELAHPQRRMQGLAADESDLPASTGQEKSGQSAAKASAPPSQSERMPGAVAITGWTGPMQPRPFAFHPPQPPAPPGYPYGGYRPAPYVGSWPQPYFVTPSTGRRGRSE